MKKLFNKKNIKIILACFSLFIVVLFYFFYIYDRKDYYICKDSKASVVTLILDVPKKELTGIQRKAFLALLMSIKIIILLRLMRHQ